MTTSDKQLIPTPNTPPEGASSGVFTRLTRVLAIATGVLSLGIAVAFSLMAVQQGEWQIYLLASAFVLVFFAALFAGTSLWPASSQGKMFVMNILLLLTLIFVAATVKNSGLPLAVICLLYSIIIASASLKGRLADAAVTAGLVAGVLASLISINSPLLQMSLNRVIILLWAAAAVLLILFLLLMQRRIILASLRIKLVAIALGLALSPLVILSVIQTGFVQNALQEQFKQGLTLAANQTASRIDDFTTSALASIEQEASLPSMINYLTLPPNQRKGSAQEADLITTMRTLVLKQRSFAPSYAILSLRGENLYDTVFLNIGSNEYSEDYVVTALRTGKSYASSINFSPITKDAYLFFSSPILNERGQTLGLLRARYDARILQTMLQSQVGLIGAKSFPVLLDEYGLRLADTISPNHLYRTIAPLSPDDFASLTADRRLPPGVAAEKLSTNNPEYWNAVLNYTQSPYFTIEIHGKDMSHLEGGLVTRLSSRPWYVVFFQETTSLLALTQEQGRISIFIATLIAGIVGVLTAIISTIFTRPIIDLTTTAEDISRGNLDAEVHVETSDEIGVMARAFGYMTTRLKTFIGELEDRVRERTQELAQQNVALQFRTRQLQTISEVARSVTSVQDLETLLSSVTHLISDRFGFYHVGIFLLDEKGEFAVLRAANSPGGMRMLARNHRLPVGQVGIVGYVTGSAQARIATDVGMEPTFFNNPDLPQTRSEMALPLIANEKVIGALDVQSTESNAFSQEEIELFAILADQIAVAISNNQLYEETRQALEISQSLHRQYLQQEWQNVAAARQFNSFLYTPKGVMAQEAQLLPEIENAFETAQPIVTITPRGTSATGHLVSRSTLAVPVNLRGETIGVIHLQEASDPPRQWTEAEISSVRAVADQVAQALENARLFEQTFRRADRERKVLEITSKIRSTNDPQTMLRIAVEELQHSLGATQTQILFNVERAPEISLAEEGSDGHQPDETPAA